MFLLHRGEPQCNQWHPGKDLVWYSGNQYTHSIHSTTQHLRHTSTLAIRWTHHSPPSLAHTHKKTIFDISARQLRPSDVHAISNCDGLLAHNPSSEGEHVPRQSWCKIIHCVVSSSVKPNMDTNIHTWIHTSQVWRQTSNRKGPMCVSLI